MIYKILLICSLQVEQAEQDQLIQGITTIMGRITNDHVVSPIRCVENNLMVVCVDLYDNNIYI